MILPLWVVSTGLTYVTPSKARATDFPRSTGYSVCGHQVVWHRLTCDFLSCNHIAVPQVDGSITERVISGSNSNSPNNTGWNRLNTNISVTVTTRRFTWQDTPLLVCHRGCQVAYLVHVTFLFSLHYSSSSCSRSPTEILEYHSAASAARGTWPRGWKRVLLAEDLARSGSGTGKIWRRLFSCWRSWGGSQWSRGGYSRTGEMEAVLSLLSIPAALREIEK
jgi:hypothetical protein